MLSGKLTGDLERKGKRPHSHALSHAISKIHVWYDACPKHCMAYFPHLLMIHLFSTILITLYCTH